MSYRVGSGTSFSTTAQATGTFQVPQPIGVQQLDTINLLIAFEGNSANWFCSSTGFTQSATGRANVLAQGPPCTLTLLTKLAGASEPANYTVTTVSGANNNCLIAMSGAWTGDSGTATGVFSSAVSGGALPQSIGLTGLSGLTPNNDLIWWAFANTQPATYTHPTGFTDGLTVNVTGAQSAYFAYQDNFTGASTGTLTGSVNGTGNTDQYGMVVALPQSPLVSVAWLT